MISIKYKPIILIVFFISILSCTKEDPPVVFPPWYPEKNENGDAVIGVYECHIPCDDCQRLKFALVFYGDTIGNLTTYMMARVFVGNNDDTRYTNAGIVNTEQGMALDSLAIVYSLENAPDEFTKFWQLSTNIVYILDDDLQPRLGDAGYGYALNKTK